MARALVIEQRLDGDNCTGGIDIDTGIDAYAMGVFISPIRQ
jgi:hypothetical protein